MLRETYSASRGHILCQDSIMSGLVGLVAFSVKKASLLRKSSTSFCMWAFHAAAICTTQPSQRWQNDDHSVDVPPHPSAHPWVCAEMVSHHLALSHQAPEGQSLCSESGTATLWAVGSTPCWGWGQRPLQGQECWRFVLTISHFSLPVPTIGSRLIFPC